MLKNYLLTALRNMQRDKLYTFINIFGLSVGLGAFILITMLILHETSYDNFHSKVENIYRVVAERKGPDGINIDTATPAPLAKALVNYFPEISKGVRILNFDNPAPLVSNGSSRFYEKQLSFVDANIFEIFTIPFVFGNYRGALNEPNSVVLNEKTAKKYFGSVNPIGKIIRLNNHLDLQITGVIKDLPTNSTLKLNLLVSFNTLYGWVGKEFVDNWQNSMCVTYLLLNKNSSKDNVEKRMPNFIDTHFEKANSLKQFYLQPMNRIHLYSEADYGLSTGGSIKIIYLISALGIFIMLIATFNYISLTTTRFIKRAKEIGVRKLLGATRVQLFYQFFGESIFFTTVALTFSLLITAISLPSIQNVFGINLSINYMMQWRVVVIPIVLTLVIGQLSGLYPAIFLSSRLPLNLTSLQNNGVYGKLTMKKTIVSVQFMLTTILIIGSLVLYNQTRFMQTKKLGFEGNQILVIPVRDEMLRQNNDAVKEKLLQIEGVENIGGASLLPGGPVGKARFRIEGNSDVGTIKMLWTDFDFIKTMGLKVTAGRNFLKEHSIDASESFIVNEEACKKLGYRNSAEAVGKTFELVGSKRGTIIGVVKDFHFASLQNKIEPIVIHIWPWVNYLLVATDTQNLSLLISKVKKVCTEFDPANPVEYNFLNENFARYYEKEIQLEKMVISFTSIALITALMGLFSLSAYISVRRRKEIGIRKVLGASITEIVVNQLKEFGVPVFIAIVVALPVGYIIMSRWLQDYAYRIEIGAEIFMLTGTILLLTALLTVGYHAVKAAVANPVDSLKYE